MAAPLMKRFEEKLDRLIFGPEVTQEFFRIPDRANLHAGITVPPLRKESYSQACFHPGYNETRFW